MAGEPWKNKVVPKEKNSNNDYSKKKATEALVPTLQEMAGGPGKQKGSIDKCLEV